MKYQLKFQESRRSLEQNKNKKLKASLLQIEMFLAC